MKSAKRKALLASIVALCGVAVAVPVVVSGTASAQTGSRLCGRYYISQNPETKQFEMAANLYEVPESGGAPCRLAKSEQPIGYAYPRNPRDSPMWNNYINQDRFFGWQATGYANIRCEDWKNRALIQGGLGGLPLVFHGENWAGQRDQDDICDNMKRSDDQFNMVSYWLYYGFDANGQPESTVHFMQG